MTGLLALGFWRGFDGFGRFNVRGMWSVLRVWPAGAGTSRVANSILSPEDLGGY